MRRIIEVSNECSPGTKENWYEVLVDEGESSDMLATVATFYTRDELEVYLHGLDRCLHLINKDEIDLLRSRHRTFPLGRTQYKYEIIPYESNE